MSKTHLDTLKKHGWEMASTYAMGARAYTERTSKDGKQWWRTVKAETYYQPWRFQPIVDPKNKKPTDGWAVVRLYPKSKKFRWAILDSDRKIVKATITKTRKIKCPCCDRHGMKAGSTVYIKAQRFSTPGRAIEAAVKEAKRRHLQGLEMHVVTGPTPPLVQPRKSLLKLARDIIMMRPVSYSAALLRT